MPINWIKIGDRKVLNLDYRLLKDDEMTSQARQGVEILSQEKDNSVWAIVNYDKTSVSTKMFTTIIAIVGDVFNKKCNAVVFVGITGLKKVMFNMFSKMYPMNLKLRASEEEAIEYFKMYSEQS